MSSQGIAEKFTEPQVIDFIHQLENTEEKGSPKTAKKLIDPRVIDLSNEDAGKMHQPMNTVEKGSRGISQKITEPQVIELSDDDQEDEYPRGRLQIVDHPESIIWYYVDPQGSTQGPFSMSSLKRWKESDYFPPGFMVWKKGHYSVLLDDMIRQMFTN